LVLSSRPARAPVFGNLQPLLVVLLAVLLL
jgi:hypothetical protein